MPDSSVQSGRTDSETSSSDSDESQDSSSHCWICLLEPNLSRINTCPKHLALLTLSNLARRQVYRSRAKRRRRYQSSDSSSSSSISPPARRKRRSMTVHSSTSTSDEELFFSPTAQSQPTPHRSSPATIDLTESSDTDLNPCPPHPSLSLAFAPSIFLDRVVHVKDDGEEEDEALNSDASNRLTITMAQATEQMRNQIPSQPQIRLKRVAFA